ncbi:MAG: VOC family protein [Flavobacteriales bacterium]|nr:VOC family protein [Flavobacteriales bacterium]
MKGIFHIAFATADMDRAKEFYGDILGCEKGRESNAWVDFDFFGHQISIHHVGQKVKKPRNYYNPNSHIPANHFGVGVNAFALSINNRHPALHFRALAR